MILHPGILALVIGSGVILLALLYAAATGAVIQARWDFSSSSAYQLTLERRTYLVSTLVNIALGFQVASIVLFVYTVDDIHRLFVGAMCATGSLNANPVGWYALLIKIIVFFLAGFWIALNAIDQRCEVYPLVRLKYRLLMGLLPLVALDFSLQLAYVLGLDPDIITSCCGSLFGNSSETTVATLSGFPVLPSMIVFFGWSFLLLAMTALMLLVRTVALRYLLFLVTAVFFILALMAIISFISTYIYELPTHHCPFDIVQKEYNYIGYPLYILLFGGVYFGMLPGLFEHLKKKSFLNSIIRKYEHKWLCWSMGCIFAFVSLVGVVVYTSNLAYFL